MNAGFDYFNLYTARNLQKNRIHEYITTDNNQKRHSSSNNKKRCSSHKNTINTKTIDDDANYNIKEYRLKNRGSNLYNYFQNNNNNKKNKNDIQICTSSSNLNTIQNNIDFKHRDFLIDKLHKELNKKNHQLYMTNNIISDSTINNNNNNEKINNNNVYSSNKLNQINNTIYNLKKNTFNNELTSKLRENENFYKKIINENLDSFSHKLIELENKNMFLIKQNQSLKNEIIDSKKKCSLFTNRKYSSTKISNEINFSLNKNRNISKVEKDDNILKMQRIITQYKAKNNYLSKEINSLKNDIKIKNSQIMSVKSQFNTKTNKLNEIFNDNIIKETTIQRKEKEIENKKFEINNLNNKIKQLLSDFEKEKKEKEIIQKLYEKSNKEIINNQNEIEKMKLLSLSNEIKLNNVSSLTHKIIFNKNLPKYKLSWSLITVKKETEIKNYLNTFWISEEEKKQINENISYEDVDIDYEDKEINIHNLDKNNEVIKKLKNIIEEKDKIIIQLKKKNTEKEINDFSLNDIGNNDNKGFVSLDKYIKIVNQLSEAKMKINELMNEKKNIHLNRDIKNFNASTISEELSDFAKTEDNGNNIRSFEDNKNNNINLNNSDDTNKYLEKYIDDLENKLEKIKNLVKLLIQEIELTNNIKNTLYNLLIVTGYDEQEAIFIIQEKQKSTKKTNFKI